MLANNLFRNIFILSLIFFTSCNNSEETKMENQTNIVFLHHSTGRCIWNGDLSKIAKKLGFDGDVENWFDKYNKKNGKNYKITESDFPKKSPYGWNNYPYDYYNIWVKNAGDKSYLNEPTLEILTKEYDIIIFKHCYPVSKVLEDTGNPDPDSEEKRAENYKLQYLALKEKMHHFI